AAMLGLLALLIAFSTSMVQERWEARRLLIVDEANAIGSAHLRGALLPPAAAEEARRLLRDYTDARQEFFDALDISAVTHAQERAHAIQTRLWNIAASEAREHPTPTAALFVSSINEIIDLDEKRLSALEAHLPRTILILLFVIAMAACGTLAYRAGLAG